MLRKTIVIATATIWFFVSVPTFADSSCSANVCVGNTVLCPDEATGYFSNVGVILEIRGDGTLKAQTLFNHTVDNVPPAGSTFTAHTPYCSARTKCESRGLCEGDRVEDAVYGKGTVLYLFSDLYDSAYVQFDDEYVNGCRKNPWTDVYFLKKIDY